MLFRSDEPVYVTPRGVGYTAEETLRGFHDLIYNASLLAPHPVRELGDITHKLGRAIKTDPERIGLNAAADDARTPRALRGHPLDAALIVRRDLAVGALEAVSLYRKRVEQDLGEVHRLMGNRALYEHYQTDTTLFGGRGERVPQVGEWLASKCLMPFLDTAAYDFTDVRVTSTPEGKFALLFPNDAREDTLMQRAVAHFSRRDTQMFAKNHALIITQCAPGIAEALQGVMECQQSRGRGAAIAM